MFKIDDTLFKDLFERAAKLERRRLNYNFHKEQGDILQRMLNVMNSDTYIRPHKHINPDKREVFIVLKGKVLVVEFDDSGNVTEYAMLSNDSACYGCEIRLRSWHSIICLEDNSVVYEVKDGPYDPLTDKIFAPWAPEEGSKECEEFNRKIIQGFHFSA
ncbi:MAG: WbuC family cupin fold metalloprotein [Bacteroidales bacterium]